MQVKIIIGTVAFMLTMILMGFYSLLEPARLQNFTDANVGRQIEAGAALFAQNCSNCHGEKGKAEVCLDPSTGEEIDCKGLPLDSYGLVCNDNTNRMIARGWSGSKESFVRETIAGGRSGGVMPTWSQEFGGPLQENEIVNLTQFVLNYADDELCSVPPYVLNWPEHAAEMANLTLEQAIEGVTDEQLAAFGEPNMPIEYPGDAERGAELYVSYACNSCHGLPEDGAASASVGPWHGELATVAETRVEGQSAEDYIYESILDPNASIVEECPNGVACTAGVMPPDYAERMSINPQDLANIVTYLMEQR